MQYVLQEPSGKFFVNPSFFSWDLTDDVNKATKFTYAEAQSMKEIIERAVAQTYWDYTDIPPQPRIVDFEKAWIQSIAKISRRRVING